MGSFTRFEDIAAWKAARKLTREVYALSRRSHFARDFALRDQIRSAAISVTSNIAEGFERKGNREFYRFLSIAKGSAGEVRSQLYVALDEGYIDESAFDHASALAIETINKIGGLMRYLAKNLDNSLRQS